jgi:DNA polymerase-1
MDSLAAFYLRHDTIKYASLVGTGVRQLTLDQIDVDRVTQYAAEDADVTRRLADVLEPKMEAAGVASVWETIDGPILPILTRMEATGIKIDVPGLAALSKEMDAALDQERRQIHVLAGGAFNVDSPKQLREILFGAMGLSPGKKTAKSKEYSTDAATLEELAEEHEIARRLLSYRELAKLKGTYVDTLPALVNPQTGACTRRTTRPVLRPVDCRRRTRICRTSRRARPWGYASGRRSYPKTAGSSWPRTTLRSSCACSRTSAATKG